MRLETRKRIIAVTGGLLLALGGCAMAWHMADLGRRGGVNMVWISGRPQDFLALSLFGGMSKAGGMQLGMEAAGPKAPEGRNQPETSFGQPLGTIVKVLHGPAERAGLRPGDRIVSVGGIRVSRKTWEDLSNLDRNARAGTPVAFKVSREGREFDVSIAPESGLKDWTQWVTGLTGGLTAVSLLVCGFLIAWRKPEDKRALLFMLISAAAAVSILAPDTQRALTPLGMFGLGLAIAGLITALFLIFLFLPAMVHFAHVFPREREEVARRPYLFTWVYGVPVSAVLCLAGFVILVKVGKSPLADAGIVLLLLCAAILPLRVLSKHWRSERWKVLLVKPLATLSLLMVLTWCLLGVVGLLVDLSAPLKPLLTVLAICIGVGCELILFGTLIFYPITSIVGLLLTYRQCNAEEKKQVWWPLWGIATALAGILLGIAVSTASSAGGTSIFGGWAVLNDFLYKLCILLIPVSMAIGILKYRVMEIDVVIKKTLVYAILTGVVLVLYSVLAFGLGGVLTKAAGVKSEWVIVASTLAVAGALFPLRKGVQTVVDRRFFRRKRDYPKALMALGKEIREVSGLRPLLARAAEILQQALQNRSVVIFARESQGSDFRAEAKVGLPDEVLGQLRFPSESGFFTVMRGITVVDEVPLSEAEKGTFKKILGAYLIPLTVGGATMGFLSLGTKLSDEELDEEDREFLTSASDQLATGIHDLAMREQERDMDRAREIQRDMLPKEVPALAGFEVAARCRPAKAMAGDYYDFLPYTDDALGICIADVVGKGLPAAMLMSNLQAGVRAIGSEDTPPHTLCEKVNNVIAGNVTGGKFITCFYGLLEAERRRLSFCNAGQNPPLLLRRDGAVERLETGGPALGLFPKEKYAQGEVDLSPGDVLLLYTDGALEERDKSGEIFGEERLIAAARAGLAGPMEALPSSVLGALAAFGTGDLEDDATIIVLRAR